MRQSRKTEPDSRGSSPAMTKEGVAEFGAALPEPGAEAAWLEQQPGVLREKLRAAA